MIRWTFLGGSHEGAPAHSIISGEGAAWLLFTWRASAPLCRLPLHHGPSGKLLAASSGLRR